MTCRAHRRRIAAIICTTAAVAILAGACTQRERYDVLTFLVDGVPPYEIYIAPPDERESLVVTDDGEVQTVARKQMIRHKPYQEGLCTDCHPGESALFLGAGFDKRGGCLDCHDHSDMKTRLEEATHVHGPVAIGNCLICHDPHESLRPHLLLDDERKLCFFCHFEEDILTGEAHLEIGDDSCTSCHDPHAEDDPDLLRPEAER